jgi:hypothetical protein
MPLGVVWVLPSWSRSAVIVRSFLLLRICSTLYMVGCSPSILSAVLLSMRSWFSLIL